jgi:hypothetical protein
VLFESARADVLPRTFGGIPIPMFSFRRLRQIWNESVCAHRAQGGRVAPLAGAMVPRARRVAAKIALAVTPALLLWGAGPKQAAAQGRAQDSSSNASVQAAGLGDFDSEVADHAQAGSGQAGQGGTGQDQTGQGGTGQDQAGQGQAGQDQAPAETAGQISVQERIRQRREQRRATAIHDAYDHLFESYVGMGYLRFQPGASLQRTTFYGWNTGLTRYYGERLGVDVDARGYYGIAYTGEIQGVSNASNTRPKISEYNVLAGPTYRFYLQPKYSISGRVLGGFALGNFSGDTNGFGSKAFGIWPDATTFAAAGSVIGQYNWSPGVSLRLTGEDFATGFGSTVQNSFGFTAGFVYRFGKQ